MPEDAEASLLLCHGLNLVILELLDSRNEETERNKKQPIIDFISGISNKRIGLNCHLVEDFTSNVSKIFCPSQSTSPRIANLTFFFDPNLRGNLLNEIWHLRIHEALCKPSYYLEEQHENSQIGEIERISYFPRESRLEALVDNTVINIVPNDISSFAFVSLLEDMDKVIGRNNLLKRSILFIKSWCLSEAHAIYLKDQKG
jgi:hypothetical protein